MTKEKSIQIIEFSGKKEDWEGWSEKFLGRGRCKGYHILPKGTQQKTWVNKVPTLDDCELAVAEMMPEDKKKKNLMCQMSLQLMIWSSWLILRVQLERLHFASLKIVRWWKILKVAVILHRIIFWRIMYQSQHLCCLLRNNLRAHTSSIQLMISMLGS